jgi:HEXXH motif-containing protein
VVATVDETENRSLFGGVSVFDLWGALFVNPRRHSTVLETAEVLVHEATHSLLFGFCLDEPLVLNPISERYASPVREDARPMDGVFHGTYVIAMLCYLLRRLVDSGLLSVDDQSRSLERLAQYGTPFDAGIKVIRDNGLLTETGRRVIDGAETYMKAASR